MCKMYLSIIFLAIFSYNYSFADCITGFACPIDKLKTQNVNQDNEFIKNLNVYNKMKINEDFMLGNKTKDITYSDLFPFTYIYHVNNK